MTHPNVMRAEDEALVQRFCDTAPKEEVMAFSILVKMVKDDADWKLFQEATREFRQPTEILDYILQRRED